MSRGVVGGKWRQLYLNNNKKMKDNIFFKMPAKKKPQVFTKIKCISIVCFKESTVNKESSNGSYFIN